MSRDNENIAPLPPIVGESEYRVIQIVTGLASRAIDWYNNRTTDYSTSGIEGDKTTDNPLQTS